MVTAFSPSKLTASTVPLHGCHQENRLFLPIRLPSPSSFLGSTRSLSVNSSRRLSHSNATRRSPIVGVQEVVKEKKSTNSLSSISQPPLPLTGRVAIVTGSSSGIGRAIAVHLAELGARIVINYITSKTADAERVVSEINDLPAREEITGKGPKAIMVQADVSEPSHVKSLFDAAESAFEAPVHILVNSAGIHDPKYPTIADTSVEDFDRIFSVNTKGAFLCSKEAANRLKQGGGGRIILVTSSTTRSLRQGYGAYAASKAAVETMVKILAKELKGTGITANCVAPGPIATEMFLDGKTPEMVEKIAALSPFGRVGETKDVVPLVGFLAGDGGQWVNGQIIPVNGGYV